MSSDSGTDGDDFSLNKAFCRLKDAVLDKKVVLKEILDKRGHKNLYEYTRDYVDINFVPPIRERQDEFIRVFSEEVEKRLGSEVAESCARQLAKYYFVSTADHHGPVCHPFFLNSNLIASVPYFEYPDPVLKNIIVLACANISLNNSSFPRGLLFNSYAKGKTQIHRLSFLPSNSHSCAVYNFRPYMKQEIDKMKSLLREKVLAGDVGQEEEKKIICLLDEIYFQEDVLNCESFSDQIVKTNYKLWKKFFAQCEMNPPDLVYVEQESLVVKLIMEHLYKDTVITHALFDPSYASLIDKYFDGVLGAFSYKEGWGTYLFWGISKEKNYRVQLWRKDDMLVSNDGEFRIELNPESLKKALEEKQIIPSMMLIFLVLSFYYGLKCLGGFNQVNYLTFMKNSYIKMQTDRGNYRSIEVCARAQTKEICGDMNIAFLETRDKTLVPATGIDLILYGKDNTWPKIVDLAKNITLNEAISPMMPEFYRIVYSEGHPARDESLLKINSEDITKLLSLDQKTKPCAYL